LLQSPGEDVAKSRLSQAVAATISGGFTKNYAWRASIPSEIPEESGGADDPVDCEYR
jgi:hypothetical protein